MKNQSKWAKDETKYLLRDIGELRKIKSILELDVGKLEDLRGKLHDTIKATVDDIQYKVNKTLKNLNK